MSVRTKNNYYELINMNKEEIKFDALEKILDYLDCRPNMGLTKDNEIVIYSPDELQTSGLDTETIANTLDLLKKEDKTIQDFNYYDYSEFPIIADNGETDYPGALVIKINDANIADFKTRIEKQSNILRQFIAAKKLNGRINLHVSKDYGIRIDKDREGYPLRNTSSQHKRFDLFWLLIDSGENLTIKDIVEKMKYNHDSNAISEISEFNKTANKKLGTTEEIITRIVEGVYGLNKQVYCFIKY